MPKRQRILIGACMAIWAIFSVTSEASPQVTKTLPLTETLASSKSYLVIKIISVRSTIQDVDAKKFDQHIESGIASYSLSILDPVQVRKLASTLCGLHFVKSNRKFINLRYKFEFCGEGKVLNYFYADAAGGVLIDGALYDCVDEDNWASRIFKDVCSAFHYSRED